MALTPETVAQDETVGPDDGPKREQQPSLRRLKVGDMVGRYVLLNRLGAGGMGIVFAAYDPDLDRKVALKLLRRERRKGGRESMGHRRLMREAQAMAKLTDPNVITVHDVGEYEGSVFIAMEFVDGHTLSRVRKDESRTWRDVLDIYVKAGRGLAAAHRAGLVHRDFKPDNVMVGHDGRVLVMDFGLARAVTDGPDRQLEAVDDSTIEPDITDSADLSARLTRTGQLVGTPAYMSPEQHTGLPAGMGADQFAFCVSLYEAIYRERPFAGRKRKELAQNVTRGRVREAPNDTDVPRWVRKVILRGLEIDPEKRWPSMDDMLFDLGRDPTRIWRRWAAVAAGVALVGGSVGVVSHSRRQEALLCKGAENQLVGVWDDARRAEVASAFEATGLSYAAGTLERTRQLLDGYTTSWVGMHVDACEAANVRKEQSTEMLDLRMACLHRRIKQVGTLVDVFAEADAAVVENAVQAASGLSRIEPCGDVDALMSAVPPPDDPAVGKEVSEIRDELARAVALEGAGRYADGLEVAQLAVGRAEKVDYLPVRAEAFLAAGVLQSSAGKHTEAERLMTQAAWAARASGHDELSARATALLTSNIGFRQARTDDAAVWAEHAAADVERLGRPPEAEGRMRQHLALVRIREGKHDKARDEMRASVELLTRVYGPEHPEIGAMYNNLGGVLMYVADYAGARESYERAVEIRRAALGPEHPEVAASMANLAMVAGREGRFEDALGQQRAALAIMEQALGADHPKVAKSRQSIAMALRGLGRFDEAHAELLRVIELNETRLGKDHPEVATAHSNLGEVLIDQGRFGQALSAFERAQSVREAKLKPDHPYLAYSLTGLGRALIELGRATEAVATLERALGIREAGENNAALVAETRLALARALWDGGGDKDRAAKLARDARDGLAEGGPPWADRLAQCDAWRAEHEP